MRAATLLHAARVVATTTQADGVRMLDQALELLDSLDHRARTDLAGRALQFSVAVAPERARTLLRDLPFRGGRIRHHILHDAVQVMLDHGHVVEAVEFMSEPELTGVHPFGMIDVAMSKASESSQLRIMRAAVQAWRGSRSDEFFRVFQRHWTVLPADEARSVVRELLAFVLSEPERQVQATVMMELGGVEFTSEQAWRIFQVLNALRRLEPELTDSLIASREQLVMGAARFPFGFDSVDEAAKARSRTPDGPPGGGFCYAGPAEGISAARMLFEAARAGDIDPLLEDAYRVYDQDTDPGNPNRATRACWPSMTAFTRALYIAGKTRALAGAIYIDRVPEPMRLLPQIEFAAGLHGLTEMRLSQLSFHPPVEIRPEVE